MSHKYKENPDRGGAYLLDAGTKEAVDTEAVLARAKMLAKADDFEAVLDDRAFTKSLAALSRHDVAGYHRALASFGNSKKFKTGPIKDIVKGWNAEAKAAEAGDAGRPWIRISTDQFAINSSAIAALAADPDIYRRGTQLVTIRHTARPSKMFIKRDAERPQICELTLASLRERLAKNATWTHNGSAANPPDWCVAAVHDRGDYPEARPLLGIVETPILRPDGSLLDEPGYDEATGLVYEPNGDFPPVPGEVTLKEARKAAGRLFALVGDFPFAVIRDEEAGTDDGGEAHRAAWLAGVLTPLARFAVDGECPLFLIDASTSGSGKTKLCNIASILATGRKASALAWSESDEELRKQILAIALAGDRMVLIDNVPTGCAFGGPALDAALTAESWKGRVLGLSKMVEVPMRAVWFATGNNIGYKGDTRRRVVPCRLESPMERPEERTGFAIKGDLLAHVKKNRGKLVVDALTILRGCFQADLPAAKLKPMDFTAWCRVVRDAIHWARGVDPCATRGCLNFGDPDTETLRDLIEGWEELPSGSTALGARQLLIDEASKSPQPGKALDGDADPEKYKKLRDVLLSWSRNGQLPSPQTIGSRLRSYRGKVVNGKALMGKPIQGTNHWWVAGVGSA